MKCSTNFAAMLSLVGRIKSSINCNPSLKLRDITHVQYTYTKLFTGRISELGLHSLQSYGCVRITSWITHVYRITHKAPNTTIAEFANTVDQDEAAHNELSYQDLQRLPFSL